MDKWIEVLYYVEIMLAVWFYLKTIIEKWLHLFVFLLSFIVYFFTLNSSLYIEDSSEFIAVAAALGIPHPTGYPLYIILGKIFSFLPFGSIPWRINLLSAVFAAGAVMVLFLLIHYITKNKIISLASALIFAFSTIWWSQSVLAEVYTLHTFLGLLAIYLFLLGKEKGNSRYWYGSVFLLGLGSANHPLLIFLLPVLFFYILLDDSYQLEWRHYLWSAVLLLLGLSLYLYIPLRVFAGADLRFNDLQNWSDIWHFLNRSYYGDVGLQFSLDKASLVLESFVVGLRNNFGLVFLALFAVSIGWWYKHRRRQFWFWFFILLSQFAPIALLRTSGYGFDLDYNNRVYYFISYAVAVIMTAGLVNFYWQKIKSVKAVYVLLSIFIAAAPFYFLLVDFNLNDRSNYCLADDYAEKVLASLKPNAILLVHGGGYAGDSELFTLVYKKYIEGVRPDVLVIDNQVLFGLPEEIDEDYIRKARGKDQLFSRLVEETWRFSREAQRPLYTTFAVEKYTDLVSRSNGIVYQVFADKGSAKPLANAAFYLCGQGDDFVQSDFAHQDLLAHYFYAQASWYWDQGRKDKYTDLIKQAIALDNEPMGEEYLQLLSHKQIFSQL